MSTENKSKLVITTVGTSFIEKLGMENVKDHDGSFVENSIYNPDLSRNILERCKKQSTEEAEAYFSADNHLMKQALECLIKNLTDPDTHAKFATAEIASLWKIGLKKNDRVVLLYSDTPEGVFCARVNAMFISQSKMARCELGHDADKDVRKVAGLKIKDEKEFKDMGLKNLEKIIDELVKNQEVWILNITGGFKGVVPWASIFAWNNNGIIAYIFEESDQMIYVGKPKSWIPWSYEVLEPNIKFSLGDFGALE